MRDQNALSRLAAKVTPSDDARARIRTLVDARIQPLALKQTVRTMEPSDRIRLSLKQRVLQSLVPTMAQELFSAAESIRFSPTAARVKRDVFSDLRPLHRESVVHSGLKWTAAFAVFILIIRSMPLLLLTPTTQAELGVQLIPHGEDVSIYVGGVWREAEAPQILEGPVMIRTGADSTATLILGDEGVLRLAAQTTVKLHDAGASSLHGNGPAATIVRGQLWALGLLPPIVDGLTLETSQGTLSLNAGSTSIADDGTTLTIAVFDKGITFQHADQTSFLVTGEQAVLQSNKPIKMVTLPTKAFTETWAQTNLSHDAVHRSEIAKLQDERRAKMAGILPTSVFYPAKRIAEHVDVLFTLTHDGRTEKRVQQANTRLSEAVALLKDGQQTEASTPLSEYRDALVSLAADDNDNLVKYLIKKQMADASTTLTAVTDGTGSVAMLKDAVLHVGQVIPDAALSPRDIEGYVLVDSLAQINTALADHDTSAASLAYADISPYLSSLLDADTGAHPLLQKEARALLVTTSSLLKKEAGSGKDAIVVAMELDLAQYLPVEQEKVLVSEEQLAARVQEIMDRIFIFRHPRSRYNQLLAEMKALIGDPNRGTLLRRLKHALPDGLGGYVNTEIQQLGDELQD